MDFWTIRVLGRKEGAIGTFYPISFERVFLSSDEATARKEFFSNPARVGWELNNITKMTKENQNVE